MKVNNVIEEGIQQGKYVETVDTTYSGLKQFQDFIYRHFKMSEHYDQLHPVSKCPSSSDITVEHLKLYPIIDLTGTHT